MYMAVKKCKKDAKDVKDAAGSLQVCTVQEAGSEAAIHAIYDIYQQDETEAVLLVDANNAFNSINRKVTLHNISITCPLITTFIANCYMKPARLFVVGNHETKSREGRITWWLATCARKPKVPGSSPAASYMQR